MKKKTAPHSESSIGNTGYHHSYRRRAPLRTAENPSFLRLRSDIFNARSIPARMKRELFRHAIDAYPPFPFHGFVKLSDVFLLSPSPARNIQRAQPYQEPDLLWSIEIQESSESSMNNFLSCSSSHLVTVGIFPHSMTFQQPEQCRVLSRPASVGTLLVSALRSTIFGRRGPSI